MGKKLISIKEDIGEQFQIGRIRYLKPHKECGEDISVSELFAHYEQSGFLYPEKKKRIADYMPLIESNWEAVLRAGKDILWGLTIEDPDGKRMASVSIWRSTQKGVLAQHLISTGYPTGACTIMLNIQAEVAQKQYKTAQNWFRPSNKYASKVFGTVLKTIGPRHSCVSSFHQLAVRPGNKRASSDSIKIVRCRNGNDYGLYDFAKKTRGEVYAEAEELNEHDIELESLDKIYRKVGLGRKRYIWMAICAETGKPMGAVIAYRGPLGLNFSLMENRCDMLLDRTLDDGKAELVCNLLTRKAEAAYFDSDFPLPYPPEHIQVTTDERCAEILMRQPKVTPIRTYNQSAWLHQGFSAWYQHLEKIYQRVLERERRKLRRRHAG